MKTMKFRFSWMAMAVAALLTACSQDEAMDNISNEENSVLRVLVQDAGFNPIDLETRAVDNGATTTFVNGDAMGVFVMEKVDDTTSKVIVRNMKLTYNGSAWTSASPLYFYKNSDYVAYFPYDENLSVTATTTAELETAIYDAFKGKLNTQTTVADYQAADLMMAKATITAGENNVQSLSFALTHRFSMVEVNIPVRNLTYLAKDNSTKIPFQIQMQNQSLTLNDAEFKPVHFGNGKYRQLMEANAQITAFSGEFRDPKDNRPIEFSKTPTEAITLAAGNYKSYTIKVKNSDSTYESYATEDLGSPIGHYFCQDGSIYPNTYKIECMPTEAGSSVIGIVYAAIPEADPLAATYNYYVLSLKSRGSLVFSNETTAIEGLSSIDYSTLDGFKLCVSSFAGTTEAPVNSMTLLANTNLVSDLNSNWNNLNIWKVTTDKSTGWFIPSAAQLHAMVKTFGTSADPSVDTSKHNIKYTISNGKTNMEALQAKIAAAAVNKVVNPTKPSETIKFDDYKLTQTCWTCTQCKNEDDGSTKFIFFEPKIDSNNVNNVNVFYHVQERGSNGKRGNRPILAF